MLASADAVISSKYRRVRGSPSDASASSAAKPAGDELEHCALALESMTPTLPDVLSMLKGESLQADARQLLQYILALQEWQRARNPGEQDTRCHAQARDALGRATESERKAAPAC